MEKALRKKIHATLMKMDDKQFKGFIFQLQDPENLCGEKELDKAHFSNKDREEITVIILETYDSQKVPVIMKNTLEAINMNNLAKTFGADVPGASGNSAATSQGPNSVQSQLSTVTGPAMSDGAAASGPEVAFVKKHKTELIQRVTMVDPILDVLSQAEILMSEDYATVRAERTRQGKMRELFILLEARGAKAIRVFIQGLKKHEPCLFNDLNEQG